MGQLFKYRNDTSAWILLILVFWATLPAMADDRPFGNPANWGGTGLLETPDARVLEDGMVRTGYAEARPFKWFTSGMGIFPGLELDFRLTEITGTETSLGDPYGNNKDKAFDLKYQVFPESKYFPAMALGLHDFHGTQLFPAEYLVLSRQVFPFDLTLGYGTDRLQGFFGGMVWAVNDTLQVLMEYSPINYATDKPVGMDNQPAVPEGADTPFNVGIRFRPLSGLNLSLSYQRGNTLGFSAHIDLDVGKEMMPKKPDPMFWGKYENKAHREGEPAALHPETWMEDIQTEIEKIGMEEVVVQLHEKVLTVECFNGKYLSNQKAVGRMFRIMLFSSPEWVETLVVVFKKRDIPILSVTVKRAQFNQYAFGEIDEETLEKVIQVSLRSKNPGSEKNRPAPDLGGNPPGVSPQTKPHQASQPEITLEATQKRAFTWGVKPNIDLYLNDPSGFFKCRVGAAPHFKAETWKGGSVFGKVLIPFYSNIESSNEPMPDAVRSDSWKYSDADFSMDMLFFDQVIKVSENIFARGGIGYFEQMYAGLSGEVLGFIGNGNLAMGLAGDYAIKRTPGKPFELMDFYRQTLLGNLYYRIDPLDLTLHSQYGKFLAEDLGWRFTITRSYHNGVDFGFWYSFTDTDDMTGFNRGYHDKGVFISIPARVFSRSETNTKYAYSISPWTRDVAAVVHHTEDLYGIAGGLMPGKFKSGMNQLTQ